MITILEFVRNLNLNQILSLLLETFETAPEDRGPIVDADFTLGRLDGADLRFQTFGKYDDAIPHLILDSLSIGGDPRCQEADLEFESDCVSLLVQLHIRDKDLKLLHVATSVIILALWAAGW